MTKETEGNAATGRVTEEDLLKSITDLEAKAPAADATAKEPEVVTEPLAKTAEEVVKETAGEELKKAIDVSGAFRELVTALGNHVDTSLQAMQKSIQGGAERDHAMIRVLTDLKKSIDANTAAVAAFGAQPGTPAAAAAITVTEDAVLEKTAKEPAADGKKPDATAVRKTVLIGLESLAKSASEAGDMQTAQQIGHATAKFESVGEITDGLLAKAIEAGKKIAA